MSTVPLTITISPNLKYVHTAAADDDTLEVFVSVGV